MRLLLVDDDERFAQMIREAVKDEGFTTIIDVANTADYAAWLLAKYDYDVLLTDYDLGGMVTGMGVVALAKDLDTPFTILWSGIPRYEEVQRASKENRPDFVFEKMETIEVMSRLWSINDELNEKVV